VILPDHYRGELPGPIIKQRNFKKRSNKMTKPNYSDNLLGIAFPAIDGSRYHLPG